MQRRRKPKAAPANVFSGGQKPKKAKKPVQPPSPVKKPQIRPHSPPSRTKKKPTEAVSESEKEDASIEAETIEVVESQILGVPRRKSAGLKSEDSILESEEPEKSEDASAIDIEVREALALSLIHI